MLTIAMRMLAGDPVKVLGIILGMTLSTALIAQQGGLFHGLMSRAQSTIAAARDVDIWVMHPATEQFNLASGLGDADVARLRGIAGVAWARPMVKSNVAVVAGNSHRRSALLMGLDDRTLSGAPANFIVGRRDDLRKPDAIAIDRFGYHKLWPGAPLRAGRELTINERRAVVVAITDAPAAFSAEVIIHTRNALAVEYAFSRRRHVSYVLVGATPGHDPAAVARKISSHTGLRALTRDEFSRATVAYYKKNTGIVTNFATTIILGVLVGVAIVGLTFSLFVLDNMANYATLKMLGVTNLRLTMIVMSQVGFLSAVGFAFGIGLAALFFELVSGPASALRGFYLPWWIPLATFAVMAAAVAAASLLSIWRVLAIEPETVLRGRPT